MPCLAVAAHRISRSIDGEYLRIVTAIHTFAMRWMNMQFTKVTAKGLVLLTSQDLVTKNQDFVFNKKRSQLGDCRFLKRGRQINACNFSPKIRCNWVYLDNAVPREKSALNHNLYRAATAAMMASNSAAITGLAIIRSNQVCKLSDSMGMPNVTAKTTVIKTDTSATE